MSHTFAYAALILLAGVLWQRVWPSTETHRNDEDDGRRGEIFDAAWVVRDDEAHRSSRKR